MPLLDHFHPPLSERRHWQAFHSRWASAVADSLNDQGLPEHLFAEPTVEFGGRVEVDVATIEESPANQSNGTQATVVLPHTGVAAPTWVIPAIFPDSFEVRVINSEGGPRLVAAIEFVSPSNKDRPLARRMFAAKCASYLAQGIHVIMVDVVTSRTANLHNALMDVMENPGFRLTAENRLYATAYRAVRRESRDEIDVWSAALSLGDSLPILPLYVAADFAVNVDFEGTYQETCEKLRVPTK
jgi:hypothetical protein